MLDIFFTAQHRTTQFYGHLHLTNLSNSATIAETILPDTERVIVREIISPPANEDRSGHLFVALSDYSLSCAADAIAMELGRERFL